MGVIWRGNATTPSSHESLEEVDGYPEAFSWCNKVRVIAGGKVRGTLQKKNDPPPHPPYEARSDILPGEIGSLGVWFLKSVMFTNFLYVGTGRHPVQNTFSLFVSSIIANQI